MLRRFFRQAWLYYKGTNSAFNFQEFALLELAYPLLTLIFYVILAAYSFNTSNLTRWVVGNSFLLCVNITLFSLGMAFDRERQYNSLRSIIVSPVNKLAVALQKAAFPMLMAIITVAVGFIAAALLFHVRIADINPGLLLAIIAVSMFASAGLGILFAAVSLLSDSVHLLLNTMSYVLMIFCGANFPIAQLPVWGRAVSYILPLTRGIQAANMLFAELDVPKFLRLLAGEFTVGAAYFLAAFILIKFAERAAIKRASLEIF